MSTDYKHRGPQDDPACEAALERAEMLQGYYTHLLVYVVVNTGLFLINLFTKGDDGSWWFYWPLLGWGIAVAIHGAVTFGVEGPLGKQWEDRKIRELLDEDQRAHTA